MVRVYFFKGDSLQAKAIKKITRSKYSHVAVEFIDGHIFDTDFRSKVKIGHLQYSKDRYDVLELDLNVDIDFIYSSLQADYDYKELLRYFINIKSHIEKYTCVELALKVLRLEKRADIISPQQLYDYLVKL